MIDYNATLQKFFDEIIKYFDACAVNPNLSLEQWNALVSARLIIRKIKAEPKKYASYENRVAGRVELDAEFFMLGKDDGVWAIYHNVLGIMEYLYSYDWTLRDKAGIKLAEALREMKLKNAKNLIEKVCVSLKPVNKFIVVKQH